MSYCRNCGRDGQNSRFCTMCGSQLDAAPGPTAQPVGEDPFEHLFRPHHGESQGQGLGAQSHGSHDYDASSAPGDVLSAADIEDLGSTHVAVNAMPRPKRAEQSADAQADGQLPQERADGGLGLILGSHGSSTTQTLPKIDAEATSVIAMPYGGLGGYPPSDPGGYQGRPGPLRSPWFWVAIVAVAALIVAVIGWFGASGGTPVAATAPPTASPTPAASASSQPTQQPTATATETPAATGLLRPGSQGAAVRQLQQRLAELGLFDGEANGLYGQDTAQAVISFQSQVNVEGDPAGVAGTHTLEALVAAGSTPTIGDGDRARAKDVRRLQDALAIALGARLPRTGRYDQATMLAVQSYQRSRGISADQPGVVDDQTWSALQRGA